MAMQPEVLILDEPTSQLDPIAASDFLNTVRKINLELGTTVIITEHRMEDIFPNADRAIVMDGGSVIADDSPRNIGKLLYQQKNDMFAAMPTPVRVFYGAQGAGVEGIQPGYTVTVTGTIKNYNGTIEFVAGCSLDAVVKGEEVNLIDESRYAPTQWEWHITNGNANYIAYDRLKTLTIDKPGTYSVTLAATNNSGTSSLMRERAIIVANADSKNGLLFSKATSCSRTNSLHYRMVDE